MILGEDSRKMSKRYGNVVNPNDVVSEYGADTLRMYEMFMGPLDVEKPWVTGGLDGIWRFLKRVWRLMLDDDSDALLETIEDVEPSDDVKRMLHRTIDKVGRDTEEMRFNTAISQLMTFYNEFSQQPQRSKQVLEQFLLLMAPYAPHFAEELWQRLGHSESLVREPFPQVDPQWLVDDVVEVPVQVNGKVREKLQLPVDIDEAEVKAQVMASERVQKFIGDKQVVKFIYVPKRIVTVVVK